MENTRLSKSFEDDRTIVMLKKENNKMSITEKNTILKTKYKYKKKPIGQGSFATVFLAINSKGEKFALKRIELNKLEPSRIEKFMLELEISQKLLHPNIVKCYDIIKTDCHWFLINELCDSGTFEDIIKTFKKLETQQKEFYGHHYLSQLKNALCYLHDNNIVHRDLKPANILISKIKINNQNNNTTNTSNTPNAPNKPKTSDISDTLNEVVKLADFGLARYFDCKPQNTTGYDDMIKTMCGSPIYMAPELINDGVYNIKADLWSFGVIMYELLYGSNPYNYPRSIAMLGELIKSKQITFYNTLTPSCLNLLKSLLKVDPIERISWDDFKNHEWFKQILTTESDVDSDIDNDINIDNDIDIYNGIESNIKSNIESNHNHNIETNFSNNIINNTIAENTTNTTSTTNVITNTTNSSAVVDINNQIVNTKKTLPKTIELGIRDREKASERARNMESTFQLLKDRGRTLSDIKRDPEISPYSSTDLDYRRRENSSGSIFYDISENFLDKHFGDGMTETIKTTRTNNMEDTFVSVSSVGENNEDNKDSEYKNYSLNKKNKRYVEQNEYKESVGSSVVRILYESVGFWFNNKNK